jgi:hypothetical protein
MTKFVYGVVFNTSMSTNELESWLENNINGEWEIQLDDINTEAGQKRIKLLFAHEDDRDIFKSNAYNLY